MNVCPMCQYEERYASLAPDTLTRFVCRACVLEMEEDIITI